MRAERRLPWVVLPTYREFYQLTAPAGRGKGIALVLVIIVVVVTVVAAVELTVGWWQISGRRVDAVAFREAQDVTLRGPVGAEAVLVELPWVEGWVDCYWGV